MIMNRVIAVLSCAIYCAHALPATPAHDYAKALHLNYLFYEAQKSGVLEKQRLAWRSDSCQTCQGPNGEDLSRGYYEAANTMKWGLPFGFMLTQNAWNAIEFKTGMESVNEYKQAQEMVKWGTDYLISAYSSFSEADAQKSDSDFINSFRFIGHLGDSSIDFEYFGPPEYFDEWAARQNVPDDLKRPALYINKDTPSSEITGESAAAMAAASILLKEAYPTYAAKLVRMAKQLLRFARIQPGTYNSSPLKGFEQAKEWYFSHGYNDEIAWASAWIYRATGETEYLDLAEKYYKLGPGTHGGWGYSWDEKGPGLHILMMLIGGKNTITYQSNVHAYLDGWLPGSKQTIPHTPAGFPYRLHWGANRYAANTAFLGLVYHKILTKGSYIPSALKDQDYATRIVDYSVFIVDYLLGSNPINYSWMVGYGSNYPKLPYHKSSFNSILNYPLRECPCATECVNNGHWELIYRCTCKKSNGQSCDSIQENFDEFINGRKPNQHILYGAIVGSAILVNGQPSDQRLDNREDYEFTEVTQDYNAGMGGALAGMAELYLGKLNPSSDCGLDLGWDHPNANARPTWPRNDCYHQCDCDPTVRPTLAPTYPTKSPTPRPTHYCPNGLLELGVDECAEHPGCCAAGRCYKKDNYWSACLRECNTNDGWECKDLTPVDPTPAPTVKPPTDKPTPMPTDIPTDIPTKSPTKSPLTAGSPTQSPTTSHPTASPSAMDKVECVNTFIENPQQDCSARPDCCPAGTFCFRKNKGYAKCMLSCKRGETYSDDSIPWNCIAVTEQNKHCHAIIKTPSKDCSANPQCCETGSQCYQRDEYWAACLPGCQKGSSGSNNYGETWMCELITEALDVKLSDNINAPWNKREGLMGNSSNSSAIIGSVIVVLGVAGVIVASKRLKKSNSGELMDRETLVSHAAAVTSNGLP